MTTGFPDCRAASTSVLAGSTPPMTSTTRSTSGSATTAAASPVKTPAGRSTGRGLAGSCTATRVTSSRSPVRAATASPFSAMSCHQRGTDVAAAEEPDPHVELPFT